MANPVTAIEVYPTCEIHLLKNRPTPMRVVVREANQLVEQNLSRKGPANSQTDILDFDTTLVDIDQQNTFVEFIPKNKTGSTIGRILHTDSRGPAPVTSEILVRIYVHEDIDKYWIGNNQVTIHEGSDNYVLSVYGYFTDGIIGDISCHRYIDFSSTGPEVSIDDNHDKGRITGVAQTSNPVKVRAQIDDKLVQEVNVEVIEPLNTPKPILRCITGSADVNNRENLLFIAEGFTADQESVFDALAHSLSHRLLNGRDNSPFNLLKDRFNIWIAFDPSPEAGVTVARPVHISLDLKERGKLLKADVNNDPLNESDYYLLQAKDNRYGWAYSHRYGDQTSKKRDNAPLDLDQWFIPQHTTRVRLKPDRRRLPRHWVAVSMINDYIEALQVNPTYHTGAQYHNIQSIWQSTGRNKSLVCWITNDDLRAASSGGTTNGVKLNAKIGRAVSNIIPSDIPGLPSYNHLPQTLDLKISPGPQPNTVIPEIKGTQLPAVIAIFAHELGHAFGLGDEYEDGSKTTLSQNDTDAQQLIDHYPNLTHFWRVKDSNDEIDLNKVVWNQWHRIRTSATLIQNARNVVNNKIELQISTISRAFPAKYIGEEVFLRTRDINFDDNDLNNKYIDGPFTVYSIDQSIGQILLNGQINNTFPVGSVVYIPKRQSGTIIPLIHPTVAEVFNNPMGNDKEPFAKKDRLLSECDTPNPDPSSAPYTINTRFPKANLQYIVALYEGGRKYNCNVYRPSGQCRMRDNNTVTNKLYPEFCAVCKYHLVNKIDPDKLSDLDKEYP